MACWCISGFVYECQAAYRALYSPFNLEIKKQLIKHIAKTMCLLLISPTFSTPYILNDLSFMNSIYQGDQGPQGTTGPAGLPGVDVSEYKRINIHVMYATLQNVHHRIWIVILSDWFWLPLDSKLQTISYIAHELHSVEVPSDLVGKLIIALLK